MMKISKIHFIAALCLFVFVTIAEAVGSSENEGASDSTSSETKKLRSPAVEENKDATVDLKSVVLLLSDRLKALEETVSSDKETILSLEDIVAYLKNKVDELENAVEKDRKKLSSVQKVLRAIQRRNLQLFEGPIADRPNIGVVEAEPMYDVSSCMPRFVNNRCIFGGAGVVAFRFENRTFFNDDVEFNENVGFDNDADCMPVFNSTSRQCVVNSNFAYESGTHQYSSKSKVTFRSKEVWMRPQKVFFRNTQTFFQGGALDINKDVDYKKK
mmetsp:Transcript_9964/g.20855  ORF Transcript_9964/g.20855 Transcript_9964/m.20855 type:complete len:271 (-) Transcript_9964:445-1257(-)